MLSSAILSLGCTCSPARAEFYILDTSRSEEGWAGHMVELAQVLPHRLEVVDASGAPDLLVRLLALLDERCGAASVPNGRDVYFVVAGIHRFRALEQKDKYGPEVTVYYANLLGSVLITGNSTEVPSIQMVREFEIELLDDYFIRALKHHHDPANIET